MWLTHQTSGLAEHVSCANRAGLGLQGAQQLVATQTSLQPIRLPTDLQAVQQLAATQQEMELLSAAAAMPEAERRRAAQSNVPPPEALQQLRAAAAGLQSQRQAVRDNLLRPSHNLPTRTLAQQVGSCGMTI